ncbi:hypothetical protein [Algoriphagus machipongonensis]|nr:hypothetical protein [Algoriphagus machipongonensis]
MMFLPISFFLIKDFKDFQLFIKSCFLVLVLHVILISIANLYNLGEDTIKGNDLGFINLALADSRLFIMAYLVGLMPFFIRFKVLKSNIFWFAIGLLNALSLILSIKRTTIVISSFLFLFGQLFSKNKKNLVYLIIVLSFVSIPLYPYIEPIFMERLESRKYFVSGEYDIEEEGRVLELGLVVDTFLENDSYLNYLFGIEPFNSINNYGFLKDRPIHNDFVYVLFSSGIVGLFLYVYMLVDIYKKFLKKFNKYNSLALVDYKRVFQSIFLMVILVSFIGNMWAITYKIFVFSVFGAFIGCNRKLV